MKAPESIDGLRNELESLRAQTPAPELITVSMRLHDRLVASVDQADGEEFEAASALYDEIRQFSNQILDALQEPRRAARRERRHALRANNERQAANSLGSGAQRHWNRGIPQRASSQGYVRVRRAKDYKSSGRRVHGRA